MKKIKKKTGQKKPRSLPAFFIGYSHADAPPPGYLAAWFDQVYGGPLQIHFKTESGHSHFEAVHTIWRATVKTPIPSETSETWNQTLQWSHSDLAEVTPMPNVGQDKINLALHTARIARGITLLTDGTAYDLVTQSFLNPSDWMDLTLDQFTLEDHVKVEQKENYDTNSAWFYTLGLVKFGLEELETFRPLGLPDQPVMSTLLAIGAEILATRKAPKVGNQLTVQDSGQVVNIVRHRTDQSTGRIIQLREVKWE